MIHLCVNCKFMKDRFLGFIMIDEVRYLCTHPSLIDVVTGQLPKKYCKTLRNFEKTCDKYEKIS